HGPPRLVLTSPPYAGVHVLYHRWQILGRRETAAPFWIANTLDGNGPAHYTFGDRKRRDLSPYFVGIQGAFRSVVTLADRNTTVVQMVAFSHRDQQLPGYLAALNRAGLRELFLPDLANAPDGRVWRVTPNRKWYARTRGAVPPSDEVVLFHRPI